MRRQGRPYKLIENEQGVTSKGAVLKSLYQKHNATVVSEEKLEELANAIGYVKNTMIPVENLETIDFKINHFKEIYLSYEEYKRKSYAPTILLDFDDMLTLAHDILEREPGILNFYQKQ